MGLATKLSGAVLALVLMSVASSSGVQADGLPYQAYGPGLKAGQVVEAFAQGVSVGKATVDASGGWMFLIPATGVSNGDKITFAVDGKTANESVIFENGRFPLPPGLTLTIASTPAPTPTPAPAAGAGRFAAPPNFGSGTSAQAVFTGGTVDQLESAALATGAEGVWTQDGTGAFQLLIVGGPSFLKDTFRAKFPTGFAAAAAVTVTRSTSAR